MSYFTAKRPSQRIVLPSDPSLWVEIYTTLTWKDEKNVANRLTTGALHADALLNSLIFDWNLTDEAGTTAPITEEYIDQLSRVDALALLNAIQDVKVEGGDETTKKSSSPKSRKHLAVQKPTPR